MAASAGWEHAAVEWATFVRSDADVLYAKNASAFLAFLPPPSSLTVDIGCGEGRFDRLLAGAGYTVVGVDGSPSLVRLAAEADPDGDYRVADASALPLDDGVADLVLSFMALHDIDDLAGVCREAKRVMSPRGSFCFSIIHPVASGGEFDSPEPDARFILDAYFPARTVTRPLFDGKVTQFHRPLSSYVDALADAGFTVARLAELPTERRTTGRVPMFLHLHAVAAVLSLAGIGVDASRSMVTLFDPAEHEPLTRSEWDERLARAALDRIVADAVGVFQPGLFWPRSLLDEYGLPAQQDRSLWIGAAGVLWALDRLGAGIGENDVHDSYRVEPDIPDPPGLMKGETGVLLVSWRLEPTAEKAERLFELVSGNIRNPEHELFNGVPGTMLAALHLFEATGDQRWRKLWGDCADAVWEQFRLDPEHGCRIWIQYRRGRMIRSIGAGHGFASNVHSLLRGDALLGEKRTAELQRAAVATATRPHCATTGLVNWPTAADAYWADQFTTRVQWCHGAPGIITSLAALCRATTKSTSCSTRQASSSGKRDHSAKAPGSATAPQATAAPSSPCTREPRKSAGSTARATSRRMRSNKLRNPPSRATRWGPATSALPSTSTLASTAGTAMPILNTL